MRRMHVQLFFLLNVIHAIRALICLQRLVERQYKALVLDEFQYASFIGCFECRHVSCENKELRFEWSTHDRPTVQSGYWILRS